MAERVGLARNIKLEWLNLVAECKLAGKTKDEATANLNSVISQTVVSKDNIRKSRTILLELFYNHDDWFEQYAVETCRNLSSPERLPVYWSLLMIRYPIFFDLCTIIGSMFDYKSEVTLAQVKLCIYENWGARTTLTHSLDKNIQTLKDVGVLERSAAPGTYSLHYQSLHDIKSTNLLMASLLSCSTQPHMSWSTLVRHPAIFPFRIDHIQQGDIVACKQLKLEKMGDSLVLYLAEKIIV